MGGVPHTGPRQRIDFFQSEPSGKDVVLIFIIRVATAMVMIMMFP